MSKHKNESTFERTNVGKKRGLFFFSFCLPSLSILSLSLSAFLCVASTFSRVFFPGNFIKICLTFIETLFPYVELTYLSISLSISLSQSFSLSFIFSMTSFFFPLFLLLSLNLSPFLSLSLSLVELPFGYY